MSIEMMRKGIATLRKVISIAALVGAAFAAIDLPHSYSFARALHVLDSDQITYDWLMLIAGLVVWFWLGGRRTKLYAKLTRDYNAWVEK